MSRRATVFCARSASQLRNMSDYVADVLCDFGGRSMGRLDSRSLNSRPKDRQFARKIRLAMGELRWAVKLNRNGAVCLFNPMGVN